MRKAVLSAMPVATQSVRETLMIYTKKGDKGKTGLFGTKRRVSKASNLIRAIGAVDEANSYLGIIASKVQSQKSKVKNTSLGSKIQNIQNDLFAIGAMLAGSTSPEGLRRINLRVEDLEQEIDKMEGELPVQTHFLLPGGSELSAYLFYARALVRRAEREMVGAKASGSILQYINRLSDYLFILARWVNFKSGEKEVYWLES